MKSNRLIRWMLILSLLLMLLPASVAADSTATVRFSPSDTSVQVGDTVTVDFEIDNAEDLYGAEVHIAFDQARLQVLDDDAGEGGIQILPGDLFPKSSPSYVAVNQADNAAGTVVYAITLLAPELPVTGGGTLASIRFAARLEGTAQLTWTWSSSPTSPVSSCPTRSRTVRSRSLSRRRLPPRRRPRSATAPS